MSRPVQITYDALAERWEIGYVDAVGATLLMALHDGLATGRDGSGHIVEIVVDAASVPPRALEFVAATFGAAVAEVVQRAVPDRDLEATITVNLPVRATNITHSIVGEPGVPERRGADRYRVPLERGDVELVVSRGELRLRLPADFGTQEWWVRVGHVDTGELLALGPVRVESAGTPQATVTFGLDLAPEQLHVTVTAQPLAPVGTREERLSAWVLQLIEGARQARRFRPRRARRLAEKARSVAMVLHDTELRRRAERLLRRQRRQSWGSWGVSVVAVLAIGTLITQTSGSTPATSPPTTVPEPVPEPVREPIGSVGPAQFQLQDQSRIETSLVGLLARFAPGDVVPITLQVTSRQRWSFGPNPDLAEAASEVRFADAQRNCLGITDLPGDGAQGSLPPFPLTLTLARLDPGDDSQRLEHLIVGTFEASREVASYTSDKDSCRSPDFNADNRFEADTSVRRTPQTIDIALPGNLPAGLWELTVQGPTPLTQQVGTLRLVITP